MMPSLLLVVFLVQLAIYLVNTLGAEKLDELLWTLYNKFPTATASDYRETTRLRREVVRLKRELGATSAQDQFARWAKLDREYNKTLTAHDKKTESLRAFRSSFGTTIAAVRWSSMNGLRFVLQFWYSREPMFWLPKGWVPGYVEWLLAFPRAPTGSISILVWDMACAYVVQMVAAAVAAVIMLERWNLTGSTPPKARAGAAPSSDGKKDR